MVKFIFARLRRRSLSEIVNKPLFQPVHNHLSFSVPAYVSLLLSKGLKYIPDLQQAHWVDFLPIANKLRRAVDCRAFFGDRPMPAKRLAKLRTQSKWEPPKTQKGTLVYNMFMRAVERWTPAKRLPNWSFWDKQAMRWLAKHRSSVKVCDSDKNMGVSLHSQEWVRRKSLEHIQDACWELRSDEWEATTREAVREAELLLSRLQQTNLCSSAETNYIRSYFRNPQAGLFRLLPKLHKTPISSRPVFTSGRSIFRGMAEWLVVLLEPLLQRYSTIAIDSDQVQTALLNWSTQWRHSADFHSVPDLQFITLDVEALYPSIDLNHLKEVVSRQILAFYDRRKAEQVIRILDLVLKINDVVFEGRIFRIQKGLPTGSPVSVVLANLYLVEMDAKLMFMPLCLYKRFIDDLCLLVWSDCAQECIRRLHSFHPDIRVKISAQGQKNIPYLDLLLTVDSEGRIGHELFTKPQSLFHYVPYTSCHPEFVFRGVVRGEHQRYSRRCSSQAAAAVHVNRLRQRLIRRGYPHSLVKANTTQRKIIRSPAQLKGDTRIHVVMRYSSSINRRKLRSVLRPVMSILPQMRISFKVQRNLFRLLYGQWR